MITLSINTLALPFLVDKSISLSTSSLSEVAYSLCDCRQEYHHDDTPRRHDIFNVCRRGDILALLRHLRPNDAERRHSDLYPRVKNSYLLGLSGPQPLDSYRLET